MATRKTPKMDALSSDEQKIAAFVGHHFFPPDICAAIDVWGEEVDVQELPDIAILKAALEVYDDGDPSFEEYRRD